MLHLRGAVITASLLVATLASSPSQAAKTWGPKHVAKLRSARTVKISPDGRLIAYTVGVQRRPFVDKNGPEYRELHVVGTDGVSRPFIVGATNIGGLQWRPDGSGVSFIAKRGNDKTRSVYFLPIDGGEARRVLTASTDIGCYAWSPDNTRIAYCAKDKKDKKIKELADKGFGQEVVEEQFRTTHLWVAPPAPYRNEATDAKDPEPVQIKSDGHVSSVVWSPSGKFMVAAIAPSPTIDDHYMQRKLHIIDSKSHKVTARFDTPGKIGMYQVSPDGKRLAVVSALDINDPREGRIAIGDTKTGELKIHLGDYEGQVESIRWKDAGTLLFLASEGVWTTIKSIDGDGQNVKTLLPAGTHVLHNLTLSRDGTWASMAGESTLHPSEVFVMQIGQSAPPRRLTNVNPWLANMKFAKQEPFTYAARDGVKVEGLLIHPLNGKKKVPLIVSVHGGPESHRLNGWQTYYSYPGQVGAAQGFAVFYPNYRGSTGRGVKFSKAGQADYAGKEFDDIIDAIDALAAKGLINPKKVGVTGGSYGGFASAWMATKHTKRFAASVMFVGISDQISKFGTTDIPMEMFHVHARKWPWEDWKFFRDRSPITYAPQSRTPILIMHGKNDTRVHPTQSMELFRYLKTIGKTPVRLVLYPGEGHGNRKAASRLDYNLRLMRWMKHYLMGKGGAPPDQALDYTPFQPESKAGKKKKKKKKKK